jgi:hypothetical protein
LEEVDDWAVEVLAVDVDVMLLCRVEVDVIVEEFCKVEVEESSAVVVL